MLFNFRLRTDTDTHYSVTCIQTVKWFIVMTTGQILKAPVVHKCLRTFKLQTLHRWLNTLLVLCGTTLQTPHSPEFCSELSHRHFPICSSFISRLSHLHRTVFTFQHIWRPVATVGHSADSGVALSWLRQHTDCFWVLITSHTIRHVHWRRWLFFCFTQNICN